MLYSRTQIVFSITSSVFWPSDLIAILCHFLLLFVFMFVSWKGDTSVVPWSSSQLLPSQYQMLLGLHFQANEGLQLSCRYHITISYIYIYSQLSPLSPHIFPNFPWFSNCIPFLDEFFVCSWGGFEEDRQVLQSKIDEAYVSKGHFEILVQAPRAFR